jgi:hypothetical protein
MLLAAAGFCCGDGGSMPPSSQAKPDMFDLCLVLIQLVLQQKWRCCRCGRAFVDYEQCLRMHGVACSSTSLRITCVAGWTQMEMRRRAAMTHADCKAGRSAHNCATRRYSEQHPNVKAAGPRHIEAYGFPTFE